MAKVFTILLFPEGSKTCKLYKNFDATINAEQRIASALYDGYVKIKGKGTVYITKYYADGYSYWNVENGVFKTSVTDYDDVKDLNHDLIGQLFETYKAGSQTPLKIVEAYTFLKEKRAEGLKTLNLGSPFRYDFRVFETFIANVLNFPQKYSKKAYEVCRVVYSNKASLYSTPITEDMVLYPDWLQPKGFESERLGTCTWKMSAELDGLLVSTQVTYDSKGISKFGPVGKIELAGKLVENYVLFLLEESYKDFTENNMDYKISQVVNQLNRYIEGIRGEDYRRNYDKTGGHMKKPDEFMVDMTVLINSFPDRRFNKNDIYAVINYFKNDAKMFKQYYEKSNKCMEQFYPWFEGRMTRGQKLFKNVPKN